MSTRTAALHTAAELTFVCLDESGEIAYFTSASKSNPTKPNVTAYDIDEDTTYCFCKGYEVTGDCWHCGHCAASWRLVAHKVRCARMTTAELLAHGQSLVKYVQESEAAGQVWLASNFRQQLDEARIVWKERRVSAAVRRATLPDPAVVLAGRRGGNCPDCGEWTTSATICAGCMADLLAARAALAAAPAAA